MRAIAGSRFLGAALAAALLAAPAWAKPAPAPAPVQGVWVSRHVHFIYQGFTTIYSCSGLRDEIERMLTKLGARDLKIYAVPCIRPGGPEPFPGVHVTMRVLVPSHPNVPAASRIAAHWHKVVLSRGPADLDAGGQCELMAQFRRVFLPLFDARRIDLRAACIPHQLTLDTYLSAEVLQPDAAPVARHRS